MAGKKQKITEVATNSLPTSKPKHGFIKFVLGGCVFATIFLVLVFGGMAAGFYAYPKAIDFIEKNNLTKYFGFLEDKNGRVVIPGGKREVISEESAVIDVVEDAQPAVVSIALSSASFDADKGVVNRTDEIGTGFFVDRSGIVATNQHVVSNIESEYVVITHDGKEIAVEKVLRDDVNDIALLVVKKGDYPTLTLGESSSLKVGQMVVAIGTPLGEFPGSVSVGIVSGLKRTVETNSGGFFFRGTIRKYENVIQTDAAINPGNSGGPLLDLGGNVIGVNFAKTDADNISFALPVNVLKSRLDEYNKFGKFLRPYLGVRYQLISESEASLYRDVVPGAFVQYVEPGSPAESAGIKKSDIITKIDGEDASSDFSAMIQDKKIGQKVNFEVYRDGKTIKIDIVLAEKKD